MENLDIKKTLYILVCIWIGIWLLCNIIGGIFYLLKIFFILAVILYVSKKAIDYYREINHLDLRDELFLLHTQVVVNGDYGAYTYTQLYEFINTCEVYLNLKDINVANALDDLKQLIRYN